MVIAAAYSSQASYLQEKDAFEAANIQYYGIP